MDFLCRIPDFPSDYDSGLDGAKPRRKGIGFAHQVSSEIEAISAIVGAGYAGKKSMTATAGPGLSLMGEGIGLAWMAEIPCVCGS